MDNGPMTQVDLIKAQGELAALIKQAQEGEDIVITQDAKPVIRLVPIKEPKPRHFGSAKGLITFADDFDAPLDDFSDYM